MNLVAHAREELQRAGLFDKDSDYEGALGEAVLELVEKFAAQGHSGFSAQMTLHIFNKVARFQTLTPITSDPSEWMDVGQYFTSNGKRKDVWQNRRNPAIFSNDGGKTWYDIDAKYRTRSYKIKRFFWNRWYDVVELVTRPFRKKRNVELAVVSKDTPEAPTEGPKDL